MGQLHNCLPWRTRINLRREAFFAMRGFLLRLRELVRGKAILFFAAGCAGIAYLVICGTFFLGFLPVDSLARLYSKEVQVSFDCSVIDSRGRLVSKPAHGVYQCLYTKDKKLFWTKSVADVSSTGEDLIGLSGADGRKIWGRHLVAHHMTNFCKANSAVALLSSEDRVVEGDLVRGDVIYIIGMDGKVLHRWSLLDHYAELKNVLQLKKNDDGLNRFYFKALGSKAKMEVSHANSIYEVPENSLSATHEAFRPGNFIVNFGKRFCIFSSDFSKVLWVAPGDYSAHDVQVL
ncbi:MAG TPA: hypothetical protein VIH99_14085, partial [Bdellovibrionota bacterium]